MATALGVVSSAISIFNFAESLLPSAENYNSKLRIYAGFNTAATDYQDSPDNGYKYNGNGGNSGSLMYADGRCPDIRLWDDAEQFLGISTDSSKIGAGGYAEKKVSHGRSNAGSAYGLFTANDDAICIAYILNKWPDGQSWHPSSLSLEDQYTNCIWLSNNGAATDITAIQVHFPDFQDNGQNQKYREVGSDAASYCRVPSLAFDTDNDPGYILYKRNDDTLIPSLIDTVSDTVGKLRTGNLLNDTRLIQSNIPEHSAIDLCHSETRVGPDFVSTV